LYKLDIMQLPKMNNTKIDQKLVDRLEKIADPGELMAELFRIFGDRAAIGTSGQWTGVALIDMVIHAGISSPVFTPWILYASFQRHMISSASWRKNTTSK